MSNHKESSDWITEDDKRFVQAHCNGGFERFESPKELSQSSIAIVHTKSGQSLFFKRSCVALLQIKSPRNSEAKWRVTQNSFKNEHEFLRDQTIWSELCHRKVFIPRTIAIEVSGNSDDFSTSFRTLTEYLDFSRGRYVEKKTFDPVAETPQLFTWLARFHAYFWGSDMISTRSRFLEYGAWWRKRLRPTVKWDNLLSTSEALFKEFPKEFAVLDLDKILPELRDMVEYAKSDSFLRALGPTQTLVHGDVKTCNFFLVANSFDVIAIDFQWVGSCASGAADVVYFFYGGVTTFDEVESSSETLEEFFDRMRNYETVLKDHYYAEFRTAAGERASGFTRELFDLHYELELLEYFTCAVPYLMGDLTPKLMKKNFHKYGYLTYEFDARMTSFFYVRALEALRATRSGLYL